jgi:hypothetical protein
MKAHLTAAIVLILSAAAPASAARFDHFNVVVRDLEKSIGDLEALGFTVKRGKPHGNGVLNAFIKMKDRSYIEMISVQNPTDELARHFSKVLEERGETAVFLALEKHPLVAAGGMTLRTGGFFSTLSYSLGHLLQAFFLIDYHRPPDDSPHVEHRNGVSGVAELRGKRIPRGKELDAQFLPLDPRVHMSDPESGPLISEVKFAMSCNQQVALKPFSKFKIRFSPQSTCL